MRALRWEGNRVVALAQLTLDLDLEPIAGEIKVSKKKAVQLVEVCARRGCKRAKVEHEEGGHCPGFSKSKRFKRPRPLIELKDLPPQLQAPHTAIELRRPDYKASTRGTKRDRPMGWAKVWGPDPDNGLRNSARIYLSQLKAESPNQTRHFAGQNLPPKQAWGMRAADANKIKAQVERTASALEQTKTLELGIPSRITITRISTGRVDSHDNLRASLKHVVDGLAEGLCLKDDHELGRRIKYEAEPPGKRFVHGVRIDLVWNVKED